jgi:glycosyltransferase involved in cell wall biosynthesis
LPGTTVLSLGVNLGIGGAVQTGVRYARERGYDIAIQFDGDGQHMAEEIQNLIAPILSGQADVVCGSRFLVNSDQHIGWIRRLGIQLLRRAVSLMARQPFTDPTSGFRAYNSRAIAYVADNYPQDYPEPESLVELHHRGFRTVEVPARMRPRLGGRSSIGRFDSVYYMIKVILALAVAASRRATVPHRKVTP